MSQKDPYGVSSETTQLNWYTSRVDYTSTYLSTGH